MSTIGVDTGGTFTDLVYLRDDGEIEVAKCPSTPPDFSQGVIDVVETIDKGRHVLNDLDYFYHGTASFRWATSRPRSRRWGWRFRTSPRCGNFPILRRR